MRVNGVAKCGPMGKHCNCVRKGRLDDGVGASGRQSVCRQGLITGASRAVLCWANLQRLYGTSHCNFDMSHQRPLPRPGRPGAYQVALLSLSRCACNG